MPSMIGMRASPLGVSEYSTRGGTSANVWRSTMPSSSSARRRSERVRGLMPLSERSSSQKRERPSDRSRTSSSVHFPHTMSAVRQTGQVESDAMLPKTLPTEVLATRRASAQARRRTRALRRSDAPPNAGAAPLGRGRSAAQQVAQRPAAPAALRRADAPLRRLDEHPALAGEGDLQRLARAAAGQR